MTKLTDQPEYNETSELMLDVAITYLEMLHQPEDMSTVSDSEQVSVKKIDEPT